MTSWITRLCGLAILVGLAWSPGPSAAAADWPVVENLRHGGYVLFLRHFNTDRSREDTDTVHLENCATQRPLSAAGRQQADALGAALRALRIPIGTVTVSPYCRAIDSAQLMGFAALRAPLDLAVPDKLPPPEKEQRAAALRQLLSTRPAARTNSLIVSHQPNLVDAAGTRFADVEEGEVVIFQRFQPATGGRAYRALARVKPGTWTTWAEAAK